MNSAFLKKRWCIASAWRRMAGSSCVITIRLGPPLAALMLPAGTRSCAAAESGRDTKRIARGTTRPMEAKAVRIVLGSRGSLLILVRFSEGDSSILGLIRAGEPVLYEFY